MSKAYQLYKISAQIEGLLAEAEGTVNPETGEIEENPEVWERLAEMLEQQEELIEDVVKEVLNRQNLINGLREQEIELARRRHEHERVVERLKGVLLRVAKQKGGKIDAGIYRVYTRRSQRVEIINPEVIPDEVEGVPVVKVERKPIKSAILRLWKQGKAVLGTKLEEKENAIIKIQ